ncbi:MAG: hypothetical protein Q8P46_00260 [Hyphomicrobiales bacterium]|nr:hypothetical protein [Hyphomicrobiales bacterium]
MTREEIIAEYGALLSEHGQWWVMESGLVAPGESNYYIPREDVARTRGAERASEWVAHVSEKTWCRPKDLIEAIRAAISAYDLASKIDWAETRRQLLWDAYVACCAEEAERQIGRLGAGVHSMSDLSKAWDLGERLAGEYWSPSREWKAEPFA